MPTFHGIDNMWLRSPYSIDIEADAKARGRGEP